MFRARISGSSFVDSGEAAVCSLTFSALSIYMESSPRSTDKHTHTHTHKMRKRLEAASSVIISSHIQKKQRHGQHSLQSSQPYDGDPIKSRCSDASTGFASIFGKIREEVPVAKAGHDFGKSTDSRQQTRVPSDSHQQAELGLKPSKAIRWKPTPQRHRNSEAGPASRYAAGALTFAAVVLQYLHLQEPLTDRNIQDVLRKSTRLCLTLLLALRCRPKHCMHSLHVVKLSRCLQRQHTASCGQDADGGASPSAVLGRCNTCAGTHSPTRLPPPLRRTFRVASWEM